MIDKFDGRKTGSGGKDNRIAVCSLLFFVQLYSRLVIGLLVLFCKWICGGDLYECFCFCFLVIQKTEKL